MKDKISIGKICADTGMPASKLRYYESQGLIKPELIDENTGYRYYSKSQYREIEILKLCSQLNFPLKKIKELKDNGTLDSFYDFVKLQKYRTRKEIRRLQAVYDGIDLLHGELSDFICDLQNREPQIKKLKQRTVMLVTSKETAGLSPSEQDDILQAQMSVQSLSEFTAAPLAKRQYGYALNTEKLLTGEIDIIGKFLHLERFIMNPDYKCTVIPQGKYVCIQVELFGDCKKDIDYLNEYIKLNKLKIKSVYATEMFLNLLGKEMTIVQFECLFECLIDE